ncbi:MAG TPA: DUF4870 domain-containing protein [Acidobacteriota bacterium]|nr:DUF4870 domain-containing protein [Acidobacteriota bacterium]HLB51005.1 DUF4870 domain-containing protein [Patescibacteria group bacterium]
METQQPVMPQQPMQSEGGSSDDVEKNKVFAIIGYIFPILFFVPLVTEDGKKSAFAKFHANQQLNFLLFVVIGYIVAFVLTFVLIGALLFPLIWIASIVFMVMGIVNAAGGKTKPLPLIGGFTLIK